MFGREQIGYVLALLVDMCVMATLFFAVPRRAADAGMDAVGLGWLSGVFFVAYAVVSPLAGKLSDRFGRKRFMVGGMMVAGALMWACAYEMRFAVLLALCGAAGAAAALFWPTLIAWFGEGRRGAGLVRVLGIYCISWNIGLGIGSVGSGKLYEADPWWSFAVFGTITLAAPLLLLLRTRAASGHDNAMPVPVGRATALRLMWAGWLANLTVLLGFGAVQAMFPQLATHLGVSPSLHGQLFGASRGAAVVAFLIMGWTHAWHHRTWPLVAGYVAGVAGALAIALTSSVPLFFAGFVVLGFVNGAVYLASIFYAMEAFEGKAAGAGWTEMILGAGSFLGPVAAGFVGDAWGLRAPYYFAAVLFVAGLIVQLGLAFTGRRR
ncbi:MAG: MFS transporter [Verrucomicrobiia bacterium]|jgi:MFS family permease